MAAPLAAFAAGAAGKLAAGGAGAVAGALLPSAEAKARKTAQDFETMFLEQTLERLLASDGTEGPLGDNGTGGEVYRSMLAKEYAGGIAKSGGVGIADQVYREILKMQESEHARQA
jgi:peptidoglycan hydrolase FlgJ